MRKEEIVAFIGATGMIGRPTATALLEAGHKLRVLSRDPNAARFPGAEAARADVEDIASLKRAFEGVDVVYVNLSTTPAEKNRKFRTEPDGLRNIIQAARESGVGKIAYISSLMARKGGYDWWMLNRKREALDILRSSGVAHMIFYPSNFMENIDQRNRSGNRVRLAGRFPHPNYWIAGRDYGVMVARALSLWNGGNREYVMQGPEPHTYREAVDIFAAHYADARLSISVAPIALLKLFGFFSPTMNYVARIFEVVSMQEEPFQSEQVWAQLGKPTTTIAAFAALLASAHGRGEK